MSSTAEILLAIILGGILGLVGQAIRAIAGLKKRNEAITKDGVPTEPFSPSQLFVSLLIGFVAGVAALFATQPDLKAIAIDTNVALGIMAAGYAGTDFVEAFMKKSLPAG